MPNISTSLGTTQRYIPAVAPSQIGRYAGLMMIFSDLASLNLAVAEERLNTTDSSPIWANGQVVAVAGEFEAGGCVRVWSVAQQHSRKVLVRPGLSVTLAADTNAVLFGNGVPSGGTGANGDVYLDFSGNAYYTKTAGAWAATGALYVASGGRVQDSVSRAITAFDNGRSLAPTGAITYTIPSGLSPMPSFTVDCPATGSVSIARSGSATLNGAATTLTRSRGGNPVGFVVLAHPEADAYGISGV